MTHSLKYLFEKHFGSCIVIAFQLLKMFNEKGIYLIGKTTYDDTDGNFGKPLSNATEMFIF